MLIGLSNRPKITSAPTVFYDKLTYVYIELPKFGKETGALTTAVDRWVYLLKHMPDLQNIPAELAQDPFPHAFAIAEEAALSPRERLLYEASLKSVRDAYAEIMSARQKGLEEGREEGLEEGLEEGREKGREKGREEERKATARTMRDLGLDYGLITQITGFAPEEIQTL